MTFMKDNIFMKILTGQIPCDRIYETERVLAFKDINPKARIHILIIPKMDYVTAMEVEEGNMDLFGELFLVAKKIAKKHGLKGFKLHMNVGEEAGQIVPHVHLHMLSTEFKSGL